MTIEYLNGVPIIDDNTDPDLLFDPQYARGAEPRNYDEFPEEMFDAPDKINLIPRSEWDARIDEQEREQSSLWHIWNRKPFKLLEQAQYGYCWSHSVVHCVMFARLRDNQETVPLSAFSIAATIKNGRNEGGWCGLAAKFARERGIMPQSLWPQGRADWRNFDKPEFWAEAAKYKIEEDWYDLTRPVHGQRLSDDQMATALLCNQPGAHDNMNWYHSVAVVQLVRIEPGSYGFRFPNSWGPGWGDRGWGILRMGTRQGRIDGGLSVRTTTISGLRNVA